MSIYLIALHKPSEEIWRRVESAWPRRHRFVTDALAFVAPKGAVDPSGVADVAGLGGGGADSGFVVAMDKYLSYSPTKDNEWLDEMEEEK